VVRALHQRLAHLKSERVGGLEVDHQLELGGSSTGRSAGFALLRILSTLGRRGDMSRDDARWADANWR
jgi:hypothetical protein